MKLLKILPVLSVICAVALSLCAVGALGEPSGAPKSAASVIKTSAEPKAETEISIIGIARAEQNKAPLDMTKIEAAINANRVFDDFIYDTAALVDEAKFTLLDQVESVDGENVIKCETVDSFVAELYGKEVQHDDGDAEYYTVNDHEYLTLKQQVLSADEADDGTVTVIACMLCGESEDEVAVTTVLSPADNSFGYIVLSAQINE